jgi:hypothetical protein
VELGFRHPLVLSDLHHVQLTTQDQLVQAPPADAHLLGSLSLRQQQRHHASPPRARMRAGAVMAVPARRATR